MKKTRKVLSLLFCFFAFFLFNMKIVHADSTPVYWNVSGSPITSATGFTKVAFEDTSQVHTNISSYSYYKDATCDHLYVDETSPCLPNSVPQDRHVLVYVSSGTLYIQFKGTLYFNANSNNIFSALSSGNVTQIRGLEYVNTSNAISMESLFYANRKISSLDLSHFDTSQVTNMKDMFGYMSALTTLDISTFNTSNVTNMEGMFQGLTALTTYNFGNINTTNVTNMSYMFAGNKALTSLDLSLFTTTNVENMSYMFSEMTNVTSLNISSFNTANVTDMSYMFNGMTSMTSIPTSYLTTGAVTNMEGMFKNLVNVSTLNLSNFNTYNLENMAHMFQGDTSLTTLNLTSFYTNMVETYESTFEDVSSLTTLNLSNFNTNGAENMSRMFCNMTSLTSIDVSGFNTSGVIDMSYMFYNLIGISSLNVSDFVTTQVTNMDSMFAKLPISSLSVSNFNTAKVTNMQRMFEGMANIQVLDLSNFNTAKVTNMQEMFANDTSLETIYASTSWSTARVSTTGGGNIFMGDVNLKVAYGDPRDPYQTTYNAEKVDKRYAIIDSYNTEGYLSVHWSISSSIYEIIYYDDYDYGFDEPDMKVDALQNYFDTSNITYNNVTPYYDENAEYLYVKYGIYNIRRFKVVKPILGIDISQGNLSIIRGRSRQLTIDYDPADTTYDPTITWESDNTSLLTVDADGTIHALQKGTVHVTATSTNGRAIANPYTGETDDSKQDTIEIEVYIPIDTFEFKEETTVDYQGNDVVAIIPRGHGEINPFDHYTFQKPTLEPHDTVIDPLDDTTESTNITWTSADTSIVTVDQNGMIIGQSPGHTTITAALDNNARYLVPNTNDEIQTGYSITYDIWVYVPIDTFTLEPSYRLYYDDNEYNHHQLNEVRQSDTYNYYEEPGTITWTSSDPTVVQVDQNGNITGLNKEGTSTITATIPKGWSRTSTVTVKILATDLTLSINGVEQTVNDTKTLEWKEFFTYETDITPDNSSYTNITWSSSNTNVATVDANGKVTATGAGDAVITATLHNADNEGLARDLNIYRPRNIHVLRPITSFTEALNPNRSTLYMGDPENEYDRALLVPTYNNGNPYDVPGTIIYTQTNQRLTITETNPQTHVAQIIAISKGAENIHTKVDHYPTSFDNSVYEQDTPIMIKQLTTSFDITNQDDDETLELEWKDTFTYTTSILPATSDYTNVTWVSSDTDVVSVDANGTITAEGPGTATITATLHNADGEGLARDLNFYEERTVFVPIPITSFSTALNPNRSTLYMGDPENEYDRALLVPTYNNGNPYEVDGTITWGQTNNRLTITEINATTHVAQIVAISKGSETIHTDVTHYPTSFDNSDYYDDTTITIKQLATDFQITNQADDATKTLEVGDTFTYTTSYLPATSDYTNITWASSDSDVVSVDANGVITALAPGTITITATLHNADGEGLARDLNLYEERTVFVPIPITSFSTALNPNRSTLYMGDPENEYDRAQLVPTYNNGNPYEVDGSLTWTLTNELVTVTENTPITNQHIATIVAHTKGTETIHTDVTHYPTSFDNSDYYDDTTITIKQLATDLSITNQAVSETKNLEWKESFTYTTSYLPATSDYTTITWASSNTNVAEVDANGTVTAKGAGDAIITATLHNAEGEGLARNLNLQVSRNVHVYKPITSFTTALNPNRNTLYLDDPSHVYDRALLVPTYNNGGEYDVNGELQWTQTNGRLTITETDETTHVAQIVANTKGSETIHTKVKHYPTSFDDSVYETYTSITIKQLATSLSIDNQASDATKTLEVGDTFTYTTSYLPATSDYTTITWASSDSDVVSVDANGTITAVAPGTVTITATLHNADNEGLATNWNKTQTRTVYVPIPITTFTTALNPNRNTLYLDDPAHIYDRAELVPTYNNGNPYEVDGSLTWTKTNDLVTITETDETTHVAQIVANAKGTETIHTEVNHYPAYTGDTTSFYTNTTITIKQLATSFSIDNQTSGQTKTLEVGDTFTYETSYLPATSDYTNVTWASSDGNVVSVDANGTITAVAPGTVTITATLHNADNEGLATNWNKEATRTVTVPTPITSFTTALDPNRNTLYLGDSDYDHLDLVPTYNNGESYDVDGSLTWTPSNSNVTVTEKNAQTHVATIQAITKGTSTVHTEVNHYPAYTGDTTRFFTDTTLTIKQLAASVSIDNQGDSSTKNMKVGDTFTYTTSYLPVTSDYTTITWASSNGDVVSVDANGTITAVAPGTVTITATLHNADNEGLSKDLNRTASRTVHVIQEIESFELSPTNYTVYTNTSLAGHTVQLQPTIGPVGYEETPHIAWSSSDASIASVSSSGLVTGLRTGSATITGTLTIDDSENTFTVTANITVETLIETFELLSSSSVTLELGGSHHIVTEITPQITTESQTITWATGNSSVATVVNGEVQAVGAGTTNITGTLTSQVLGTKTITVSVTVMTSITRFELDVDSLETLIPGQSHQLVATIEPSGATNKQIEWTSTNPSVASVNDGLVIANAVGTATIIATIRNATTSGDLQIEVPVRVLRAIDSIAVAPTSITLVYGTAEGEATLEATILPANAEQDKTITWRSSDDSVVEVTQQGKITARAKGTATVSANLANGMSASCEVTVFVPITTYEVTNGTSIELYKNQTHTIETRILPSDPSISKEITWTSDEDSIATVNSSGTVTAVDFGTTTIRGTLEDDEEVTVSIKVIRPISNVTISQRTLTLDRGDSEHDHATLSLTIDPPEADGNKTVQWSSSDTTIATVDENGVVTAVGNGNATITGSINNEYVSETKSDSCEVTVVAIISNLSITEGSETTVHKGKTAQLHTSIYPNNPTETPVITWSSTDTTVATVNSLGLVTAKAKGDTVIKATLTNTQNALEATITVHVDVPITSFAIGPSDFDVEPGDTKQMRASVYPKDAASTSNVVWSVEDDSIATISSTGLVTGVSLGTTTITATIPGTAAVATATVTVTNTPRTYRRGDFNRNGTIELYDVIEGLRKIYGYTTIEPDDYDIGDLNNDGSISVQDIIVLLRYINGYIDFL